MRKKIKKIKKYKNKTNKQTNQTNMPKFSKTRQVLEENLNRELVNKFNRVSKDNGRTEIKFDKGNTLIIKVAAKVAFTVEVSKKYKKSNPKLSITFSNPKTIEFFQSLEDRIVHGLDENINLHKTVRTPKDSDYDKYLQVSVAQKKPGVSKVPIYLVGSEEPSYDLLNLERGMELSIFLRVEDYMWEMEGDENKMSMGWSVQAEVIKVIGQADSYIDRSEQCNF